MAKCMQTTRRLRVRILLFALLGFMLSGCAAYGQPPRSRRIRNWARLLSSDDPLKRSSAATSLLALNTPEALQVLIDAMAPEKTEDMRVSVITAFGVMGDDRATRQLIDALEDKGPIVRQAAAAALQTIDTPTAVLRMEEAFSDPKRSPQTRSQIIAILGEMRAMASIPALIQALSDADPGVRKAADSALQRITLRNFPNARQWETWWQESKELPRDKMLEDLVTALEERLHALQSRNEELELLLLSNRRDPQDPAPLLETLAASNSRKVKLYILNEIVTALHQSEAVVAALTKALDDPDAAVRQKVVEALAIQGSHPPVEALMKAAEDPIYSIRVTAIRALGGLKAEPSADALLQHLRSPSPEVAAAAAWALGEMASRRAVEPLIAVAGEPQAPAKVREEAANALAKIKDEAAVPVLIALVKSTEQNVRAAAVDALGTLKVRAAVEPLCEVAVKDENLVIRELALVALGRIGDPAALDVVLAAMESEHVRVRDQALRSLGLVAEQDASVYPDAIDRLVNRQKYDMADTILAHAIERYTAQPNHGKQVNDLRLHAGRAFARAKQWDKARPHFDALVRAEPKNPEALRGFADVLNAMGDRAAYIEILSRGRQAAGGDEFWWSETLRVLREIFEAGNAQQVIDLVDAMEKEPSKLGDEKYTATLRELRTKAKEKLTPLPPAGNGE